MPTCPSRQTSSSRAGKFPESDRLSAAGIPTITLVFGSSTAGGAYVPGMSDYVVMQREAAKVFLGGPPLVKMAIDEDADEEPSAARRCTRAPPDWPTTSPQMSRMPADGREIVAHLGWRKGGDPASSPVRPRSTTLGNFGASPRPTFACRSEAREVIAGSSTAVSSKSSSRCTAPPW